MVVIGNSIKHVNPCKKQTDYSDLTLKEQNIQYKLESHNKSSETESVTETIDLGSPEEQDIKYKIESHKDNSDSSSIAGDDMEITINEVQDILENKDINSSLMKSGLEKSFEILKGKIASTRADAANGEWIDPEKIKTKWWIDETLRFKRSEKNPDTYCIYQKDSKGEWVVMGWTDAATAFAYSQDAKQRMIGSGKYYQTDKFGNTWEVTYDPQTGKILKGEHKGTTSDSTNLSDVSNEQEIPEIVDASSNKTSYVPDGGNSIEDIDTSGSTYVNSSEIPESVQNEIKDYIHKTTDIDKTNPSEQQNAYNSLSDDAKKIIDGKVKIVNIAEKSIKDMMINQEDIIIPKGKNLYVNGAKVIGSDCTFRYDSNTQKYRLVTTKGSFAAGGYTVNELYESEIK